MLFCVVLRAAQKGRQLGQFAPPPLSKYYIKGYKITLFYCFWGGEVYHARFRVAFFAQSSVTVLHVLHSAVD